MDTHQYPLIPISILINTHFNTHQYLVRYPSIPIITYFDTHQYLVLYASIPINTQHIPLGKGDVLVITVELEKAVPNILNILR